MNLKVLSYNGIVLKIQAFHIISMQAVLLLCYVSVAIGRLVYMLRIVLMSRDYILCAERVG